MMGRGQEKMAFLEYYLEEFVEKGKEQILSPMFDCDEAKMMDSRTGDGRLRSLRNLGASSTRMGYPPGCHNTS